MAIHPISDQEEKNKKKIPVTEAISLTTSSYHHLECWDCGQHWDYYIVNHQPPHVTQETLVGAYLQGELNSSWLGNSFRIWDFSPLPHLALGSPEGWMDAAIDGHGLTV